MSDQKYVEMIGYINEPFNKGNKRHASTGWYLDFEFTSGGKILPCRVWDSVADECMRLLEPNSPLLLVGYMNGVQLKVKSVRERKQTKHEADKSRSDKWSKTRLSAMAKNNFHPVQRDGMTIFCHEADLIKRNGLVVTKLDFCLNILGDHYVVKALRDCNLVTMNGKSLQIGAHIRERYLNTINRLTQEALEFDNVAF